MFSSDFILTIVSYYFYSSNNSCTPSLSSCTILVSQRKDWVTRIPISLVTGDNRANQQTYDHLFHKTEKELQIMLCRSYGRSKHVISAAKNGAVSHNFLGPYLFSKSGNQVCMDSFVHYFIRDSGGQLSTPCHQNI
jgi:hypothetical protein